MAGSVGNLLTRIVAAAVLAPLVLGAIYLGGWAYAALLTVAAALALHEWLKLVGAAVRRWYPILAVIGLLIALAATVFVAVDVGLIALAIVAVAIYGVGRSLGNRHRLLEAAGILYVGIPVIALWWLRHSAAAGIAAVLWLFLVVWATDIGGYFVGKGVGGPKLAPRISPKKTWSGLIGAMVAAGIAAAAVAASFDYPVVPSAMLGAIMAVVAQLGDLFESAIKRRFDVKDSGALIPGHGGILDRIDGLLAAAPALAAVLILLESRIGP